MFGNPRGTSFGKNNFVKNFSNFFNFSDSKKFFGGLGPENSDSPWSDTPEEQVLEKIIFKKSA